MEGTSLSDSQQDSISWIRTADGTYSSKSAYAMHFMGKMQCATAAQTWSTKAPPKCKLFTWLMLQNRIRTAARLQVRGWPNEYFFQLCLRNLETTQHLFCECPMVREVWKLVGLWIHAKSLMPENWTQGKDLQAWFTALVTDTTMSMSQGVSSMAILTIWEICACSLD